jgi:hypothetical protein
VIIAEPGEYQAKAPVDEIGQRTPQTLCSPDALRFNSLSYPEIRHGSCGDQPILLHGGVQDSPKQSL